MKTLYLECKMGAAGDMLGAALLGLIKDENSVLNELNAIGLPGVKFCLEKGEKCGIKGNHLRVIVNGVEEEVFEENDHKEHSHEQEHHHQHHHSSLMDIEDLIESTTLSKDIKSDVREVYALIAEAESEVHGVPVSQIHFHELGTMDALADIIATCYIIHKLNPDKVVVSPINVGGGTVKCAHGILPVPAPATANLLKGIPSYESISIKSELCTPTGAALIKYFADDFSQQPVMMVDKISYGLGKKDFPQANALRAMIGETNEDTEHIVELACNIDDMTAEEIGFATERLFEEGALDVYTISVGMKKNRIGMVLNVICKQDVKDRMVQQIFKHTTTLGVRENICNRYVMTREIRKLETPYGEVREKIAYGFDTVRKKLEYDDIAGIARRTGKSIIELKKELSE